MIRYIGFAIGLLSGTSAFAQVTPASPPPSAPASTQEGDIVVIAQRRAQSLQDVSLAVTATLAADKLSS